MRTVRVFVVLVVVAGAVAGLSAVDEVVEDVVVVVVVSDVVGVDSVTGGVVGDVVVVVDVEDGTCWANKGVEESARTAAIAGRALVRA